MRHFIYQDEKSHKFWAVEQQGNELHISWGKVGTKGQSQIKSFSDAAAAEKAELKLIAEKVKKGYVEQAKDNSLQPSQTVTGSLKVADLSTIIQEQPSFVAETRAPDKNTDAVLPWLAKDIAVVFPPEVVHTTLSHRRFPGVPVQQADKLTQLRRLACSVSQRDNKTATFDFSACSLEWQNTVAQAISQIDGLKTTQLPSPVMAVLTALEMKCTRYKVREDVMDQIVQEGGLEYATDVIIHLQQIDIEWDYANNVIIILPSGIAPSYLEQYSRFELRLKRRFDFETVFPIMDFAQELELVASASARLLAHSGIPHKVPDAVLELLVRTFRDLRANGEKKTSMDTLTAIMSTAEAVNVAHAVGVRAWFLANRAGEPADLVECIAGTIVKDNEEDRARLRRYFEQRVATHKEAHWQAYYQARHRLP